MATAVNDRSKAAAVMAEEWPMLEALMSGTRAMRQAGEAFMPKFPSEEPVSYQARLATATLFPAYRRTVSVMSGKPFSKPVTLNDDPTPDMVTWCDDVDREGVNLHAFAAEMFRESFYGMAGILVDAPRPVVQGRVPTKAEQDAAGTRPYFVRVMHGQLLGWRTDVQGGARKLTQLRIRDDATVEDGDFGEKVVERVRVLEPGSFRVYEKQATKAGEATEWVKVDEGLTSLNYIPFVPLYGWRVGFMQGVCPLLDLAYMNVKHWQSQSDQDNLLHVARVPILFTRGMGTTELVVGAGVAVKADSVDADMKYVEHTGEAIGAGSQALKDLEDQMIQAGAELLVKKPGDRSATESANDAEANKCDLQRITETFEDALNMALAIMAELGGQASAGRAELFKDFGAANLTDASGQLLMAMRDGGLISDETAIREFQRRGALSDAIDPEEEADRIIEQIPDPGEGEDEEAAMTPVEDPDAEEIAA